jgi:hypothetical protein|tara:strand:- start:68 stop:229 length:162 start_codon:yes stop_codon:yes gene_type:complete
MDMQVGIEDILRNLSERGQLEWELAVKRTENEVLQQQLSLLNGAGVEEEILVD